MMSRCSRKAGSGREKKVTRAAGSETNCLFEGGVLGVDGIRIYGNVPGPGARF